VLSEGAFGAVLRVFSELVFGSEVGYFLRVFRSCSEGVF
jgi:hypothetical protein